MFVSCVLRYKIEEGLKRLREVKPAGETYMHEGIKEVSSPSQRKPVTAQQLCANIKTMVKLRSDEMFVVRLTPEGLGSDPEAGDQVLQHHPGPDGRETRTLRPRARTERGERQTVGMKMLKFTLVPTKLHFYSYSNLVEFNCKCKFTTIVLLLLIKRVKYFLIYFLDCDLVLGHPACILSYFLYLRRVAHNLNACLLCRLIRRGITALVFTAWVSRTSMSSR